MANYLCAVLGRDDADVVAARLNGDTATLDLGEAVLLIHPAEAASPAGLFMGYAVDHEARRLSFPSDDAATWPQAPARAEGAFVCARRVAPPDGAARVEVFGDLFAQVARLYFRTADAVVVSDSLSLLCAVRRALSLPNRPDEQALLARLWTNAMAAQPMSNRMVVEGIRMMAPGGVLDIAPARGSLACTLRQPPLPEVFGREDGPYAERLAAAAARCRDVVGAVAMLPDAAVTLDISGGLDSRVCLAALLAGGHADDVAFASVRAASADLGVAGELAASCGFALNAPPRTIPAKQVPLGSKLTQWAAFNQGLYDPLHAAGATAPWITRMRIGGHGAELLKGNYGWRRLASIARLVPPPCRDAVAAEFEAGAAAIGIERDHEHGAEWHYAAYRNPVHSGRFTMTGLSGLRPIQQRGLVSLAHAACNPFRAPGKGDHSIVADLLVALSPALAAHRFDDPKKAIPPGRIAERRAAIPALPPFRPYEVAGRPRPGPVGASAASRAVATEAGFVGGFGEGDYAPALRTRALDGVPASLASAYAPLIEDAARVTQDSRASSPEARALGKLLISALFD